MSQIKTYTLNFIIDPIYIYIYSPFLITTTMYVVITAAFIHLFFFPKRKTKTLFLLFFFFIKKFNIVAQNAHSKTPDTKTIITCFTHSNNTYLLISR